MGVEGVAGQCWSGLTLKGLPAWEGPLRTYAQPDDPVDASTSDGLGRDRLARGLLLPQEAPLMLSAKWSGVLHPAS